MEAVFNGGLTVGQADVAGQRAEARATGTARRKARPVIAITLALGSSLVYGVSGFLAACKRLNDVASAPGTTIGP
jgi:hypothetical protein